MAFIDLSQTSGSSIGTFLSIGSWLFILVGLRRAQRIEEVRALMHVETIPGMGQDGAAIYISFIGNPKRFGSLRQLRGWSGMIPNSKQSADSQAPGLKITQAGPSLIKKFAFLDAESARQSDPQTWGEHSRTIAAIYYDQMVHHGKHHVQAVCTCSAHLLDRVGMPKLRKHSKTRPA